MEEQDYKINNLVYFECSTMKELYDAMENWQNNNHRRFVSLNIQQKEGIFYCIALIHPWDILKLMDQRTDYVEDMRRFRRKAMKKIGVDVSFKSDCIPYEQILRIQKKLVLCATTDEVNAVFDEEI